ncbi:MAG: ImmA/IrrE family metallo-endopeptidase [Chloroflexi bacterium]|nr:ImmA/IrrE family metallo-endopeptidase [Chloroflexota bacterium]MYD49432.1 ImmA/IrrE family metallo-endopeptidase [Chloroflexota bacterium]
MTKTLGGFCRALLDDSFRPQALDPERMAARFVDHFALSARPSLEELTALAHQAGFGAVREEKMDGLKGAHVGQPGGQYHIYHRDDLWEGAKAQTVLHELYEIALERLAEMHSPGTFAPTGPNPGICRQAERFAAAVLMQPDLFVSCARASGLDVVALRELFNCSYASVALRIVEVVRHLPLMVVLYERDERGDPTRWPSPTRLRDLKVKVVKRTTGFAPSGSRLLGGLRGGAPYKRRSLSSGSLAEQAARSGEMEYAEGDGLAAAARPVLWKGRLGKVAVVAVPWEHRRSLEPQLVRRSQPYLRHDYRAATAAT